MNEVAFVRFQPEHLFLIDLLPDQRAWLEAAIDDGHLAQVAQLNSAWTGIADGRILGSAGFIPHGFHCSRAWAMFGQGIPRWSWLPIVGKIRHEMRRGPKRIEATVKDGFGNGCRLAHLLGFTVEGKMRAWGPDGADYFLYAQVKP